MYYRRLPIMSLKMLCVLFCLVALSVTTRTTFAQAPYDQSLPTLVETKEAVDYVKIDTYRRNIKVLRIRFPWRQYTDASIEVRLVTSPEADVREINPIHFVGDLMSGTTTVNVTAARTAAFSSGYTKELTVGGIDFSIRGRRNLTGRPSVHIVTEFPNTAPAPGAVVIYPFLEDWSISPNELFIELPKAEFARPGELNVWFMRAGRPIWRQRMFWKGYEDFAERTPPDRQGGN